MTRSFRAQLAAIAAATLAGCASGGGDTLRRFAGPTVPPPAPIGEPGDELGGGSGTTSTVGDVQVTFTPDPGGSGPGKMTLVVGGQSATFDLAEAQVTTLADGLLARSVTATNGWTAQDIEIAFGKRASRIVLLNGPSPGELRAIPISTASGGAPTIPSTGTATFDTVLAGTFRYDGLLGPGGDDTLAFARGLVKADFSAGALLADFPDVDFSVDGNVVETTRLGDDWGFSVAGVVVGGGLAFSGNNAPTRDRGSIGQFFDLQVSGSGTFLGPTGGAPTGVAGDLSMNSTASSGELPAFFTGAFEGVCACLEPTPAIPTTGVATFDTGLSGVLRYQGVVSPASDDLMFGRGAVAVDFGGHTLTGAIPDVDFIRSGVISETTLISQDFGLALAGTVTGDQVSMSVNSTTVPTGPNADITGTAAGTIAGAPGRLELGAKGTMARATFDEPPEVSVTIGFSGVAPAPGQ